MTKNIFYYILLAVFTTLIFIPVHDAYLLRLNQKQANDILSQKLATEQNVAQVKKNAAEKIYLLGKFNPVSRKDFAAVPAGLSISGYTMYLRKETLNAFLKMEEAADKDGIELKVASATRNFDYQKNLWNNKWTGETLVDGVDLATSIPDGLERFQKILEYSAAPGTSRHHWGTDIDLNNANPEYFETESGEAVYEWLTKNAASFGFCQPYTLKGSERPTGYNEEKWHWSYLPLSKTFIEEYKNLITTDDLKGFDGDKYVPSQNLIDDYVLGTNPECL